MADNDWISYLTRLNRSPETVRTYRSTLDALPFDPATASREDVEAWWETLPQSPDTRRRILSTLRSYYRWSRRFDRRADDPTVRLDPPETGRHLPRWVSRSELATLLDALDGEMRRAVALGAYAGLRVAEAAALDWSDVDLEESWITVRSGKGDKDRVVDLPALLADELRPDTGGNVVTAGGDPYTANALQRRVNRAIRASGVDQTFHRLRARYATVGLAVTGNLMAVSRALGHSSPTVTARYAATSGDDLRAIGEAVTRG